MYKRNKNYNGDDYSLAVKESPRSKSWPKGLEAPVDYKGDFYYDGKSLPRDSDRPNLEIIRKS